MNSTSYATQVCAQYSIGDAERTVYNELPSHHNNPVYSMGNWLFYLRPGYCFPCVDRHGINHGWSDYLSKKEVASEVERKIILMRSHE
jgi:hypothetical protein